MKNILVPTDFSDNAKKALDYGAKLALRCSATLHIVHAYSLLENIFIDGPSMRDVYNKNQQDEKTAELLRLKQYLHEDHPGLNSEIHLFTGPTQEVLINYVEKREIDLIVMGTQGASGLARVIVGSVTASVIEHSPVPVLAIPMAYQESLPTYLVLATRNFERDSASIKPVFELAAMFDIPVRVFVFMSDNDSDIKIAESALQLQEYSEFLKKSFPLATIKATFVEGDDFESILEAFAEENPAGIVCMLTHKRSFPGKFFNPSITKKIACHTKVPLLAIPVKS